VEELCEGDMVMPKRILAVDDSEALRNLLMALLSRSGYDVALAADGRDALKKLTSFDPDLILLDIQMPRLDGWEFLELAHKHHDLDDVPVIIFTGKPEPEDHERELACRYAAYVTKKVRGEELLGLIERVLAGELPEQAPEA